MDDLGSSKSGKDDIQIKLDKKLGPEYISKRVGFGSSRVAYIEGWKAINLANQIFGYNGWSTEVKSVTIDFLDERQGRYSIGCTAIVRVSLQDGTFREDIGYGTVENERRKPSAFERAKKSAVTDALKRALRGFGNALGNCLYDKDFLAKIDKVKFDPPDFDEGNLFRPTDELSEVSRSNTMFTDTHVEGPLLKKRNLGNDGRPAARIVSDLSKELEPIPLAKDNANTNTRQLTGTERVDPPTDVATSNDGTEVEVEGSKVPQDNDDLLDDSFMFSDELQEEDILNNNNYGKNSAHVPCTDEPVTFVTAKAASDLQRKTPIPADALFDPKFQAQSIRHTVDQSVSSPVSASVLKEKGIDSNRTKLYTKYAPRGKELATNSNTTDAAKTPRITEQKDLPNSKEKSAPTTNPVTTKSSIPVHPSSNPSISQRMQVGRPRMLQQPNLRRNVQ